MQFVVRNVAKVGLDSTSATDVDNVIRKVARFVRVSRICGHTRAGVENFEESKTLKGTRVTRAHQS